MLKRQSRAQQLHLGATYQSRSDKLSALICILNADNIKWAKIINRTVHKKRKLVAEFQFRAVSYDVCSSEQSAHKKRYIGEFSYF